MKKQIIFLICFFISFSIICNKVYSQPPPEPDALPVPYTESFEGPWSGGAPSNFPNVWSKQFISGTTNWVQYEGCLYENPHHRTETDSINALFYQEDWSEPETRLITPVLDFGGLTYNAQLSFWHAQAEWEGDQDTLSVYYRIPVWNPNGYYEGAWNLLISFSDSLGWTQTTIDLPFPGSKYQICFRGYAYYGFGIGLDQVEVTGEGLIADFSADQILIVEGTQIQFTDLSTGSPTSWEWDFQNDGTIDSYVQHPAWTYNDPGLYTVSLTVSDGSRNSHISRNSRASSTETKIDYIDVRVNIPDASFKAKINAKLGQPAGYNPTVADLNGITGYLNAHYSNISSIEGAQYLTNLTTLYLYNNQIIDISAVSGLTNLTHLNLHVNQIINIAAISGLTNLANLDLYDNQIIDISAVSDLANLTDLDLGQNQIIDISAVSGLTNLEYLYLYDNQIIDISAVSGLTNLTSLCLDENQIIDISAVSGLTNLADLDLDENQINDVSAVSGLTNLDRLYLESNQTSDIFAIVENNGFGSGNELYLDHNPLSQEALNIHIPILQSRGFSTLEYPSTSNNYAACYPNPTRNETEVSTNTDLEWRGNFPTDDASYDVWLGETNDNLVNVGSGTAINDTLYSFDPTLNSITDYWWKVRAVTATDTIWSGLWHFTTESLNADFSADQILIVEGTEIQFTDLSTGSPTSWEWDFQNDGTIDSYVQHPAWTYNDPGLYTVSLTVSDGSRNSHISRNSRASSTETKIDYIDVRVNIPDANFKAKINAKLGQPAGYNPSVADLNGITGSLYANYSNISSIEGAQYLSNLTKLDFEGNQIIDISAVSGLTSLTDLTLWDNQIIDISAVSGLTNLEYLDFDDNQITDIYALVENTGLGSDDYVDLSNNPLSHEAFDVHIPILESRGIYIYYPTTPNNNAACYPNPTRNETEVSTNTDLEWRGNFPTDDASYDVWLGETNDNLVNVGSGTAINDTLYSFDPTLNSITDYWWKVRAVTATDTIWSGLWHFTTEPIVADFVADQTLVVTGTEIQFTDLSTGSPTTWEWDFENDGTIDSYIQNPTWTYNDPGLYSVSLTISDEVRDSKISRNPRSGSTVSLTISDEVRNSNISRNPRSGSWQTKTDYINVRVNIPDANFKAKINARLGQPAGYNPTEADLNGITGTFDASYSNISSIEGAQYLTNLADLDLEGNQIIDIAPVSGLTNLTVLNLLSNQIIDISALAGLTSLVDLDLEENQIIDVSAVSGLTNLTWLSLWNNQIIDISAVSSLTNLTCLLLDENQIIDISAISGLTNLTELRLQGNQIIDISAVSGLTNLTYLKLSANDIIDISAVSGLTNLTNLRLNSNQIIDISAVSGLTNLETLYCSYNNVSDIFALVENTGLGSGDRLYLNPNPHFSYEALNVHIPILQSRGFSSLYYPSTPNNYAACYPDPTRNETVVPLNSALQWRGNFPTRDAAYDVWLGETNNNLINVGSGTAINDTLYSFVSNFEPNTGYWWKVRAVTAADTIWSGLWHFISDSLEANFSADQTSVLTGTEIQFTDLSIGDPTSWEWDFDNDGNIDSYEQNTTWTYTARGYYSVKLSISGVFSEHTEIKEDYISLINSSPTLQNPLVDFSFDEDASDSSIDLFSVFDDPDLPYGDSLSFTYSGNDSISVEILNGSVTLTPAPDWYGYENITFTAFDDSLASIPDTVKVAVAPKNDPPVNTAAPVVSGNAYVHELLSVTDGTWNDDKDINGTSYTWIPTYTYQWKYSTDNITFHDITDETASTLTIPDTYNGYYVLCEVTATDAGFGTPAFQSTSANSNVILILNTAPKFVYDGTTYPSGSEIDLDAAINIDLVFELMVRDDNASQILNWSSQDVTHGSVSIDVVAADDPTEETKQITFTPETDYIGYAGFTISVTDNVTEAISTLDFNITIKPFTVYVDDDWTGYSYGDAVADTLVFGQDAFLVVNNAIVGVAPTGTMHVATGTYNNGIHIDKSLTMTTTEEAVISLSTDAVNALTISADDVSVEGFIFQDLTNAVTLEGMNITITACRFDNCVNGVINTGTYVADAIRNWWDDLLGPSHPSNPHYGSTSGSVVSDNVNFIPWNATETVTEESEYVTVSEPDSDVVIIAVSDVIQAGVHAALDGNIVDVTDGTYTEDLTVDAGIILRSENGKEVTFIQQIDGVGINVGENADNFTFGGADYGFTILSGNNTTQSVRLVNAPGGVSIIDNSFDIEGYAFECISVNSLGATDLTISDNTFLTDTGDSGIWIPNSTNAVISGNTFICSGDPISGWAMHISGCTDPTISDNTITNFNIGLSLSCGAGFIGGVINGNTISGCAHSIYISQWSPGSSFGTMTNVELSENTISSDQVAIYIGDGNYIDASTFIIEYNNFAGGSSDFISRKPGKERTLTTFLGHLEHLYGFIVTPMDLIDYGIYNAHSTEVVLAEDNWWNDINGPYHDPNNLDTNGLNVSENVDFRPWAVGNPAIDNLDHVLALTITSPGSVSNMSSISPIPFEVDYSEAVQNFDKDTEISIIGDYLDDPVTITDEGNGLFTFDLTPAMDNAEMTVSVAAEAAEDVAGNYNQSMQLTITYDALICRYIITITPTSPYLWEPFDISVEAVDMYGYRDTDYGEYVLLDTNHDEFVNLSGYINLNDGYAEITTAGMSTQLTNDLDITAYELLTGDYLSTLEDIVIQLPPLYPPTGHDGIGDPVVYDVPDDQGGWITLEYGLSPNDPFHAEPILPYIDSYLVERNNEPDGSGEWETFCTINCYSPNAAGNVTALLNVPEGNTSYPYRMSALYIPDTDEMIRKSKDENRQFAKLEITYLNGQPVDETYYTSKYAMCGSAAGADNIPAFADIKVYLEGPYDTDNLMMASHEMPLISPYSGEDIGELPNVPDRQLIDWVELQLRTTETGETEQQADAFLLDDGSIVNTVGYKNFPFAFTTVNEYFLIIHHRNHLDVMTANTYLLGDSEEATTEIDLSYYQAVFGHDLKQIDEEVYALYSGDANDDGLVDLEDLEELSVKTEDDFGYFVFDFDMNGYITSEDIDNYFWPNLNVVSQVPGEGDSRGDNSDEITSGELETNLPQCVPLHSYPNPFNPSTTIKFSIAEESQVELTIFNLKGQKIITLVAETLAQRTYSFEWNGEDELGQSVVSGIYFYRLKAGIFSSVKKMILLK